MRRHDGNWVATEPRNEVGLQNLGGVSWHAAPIPRLGHRHRAQTRGYLGLFDLVERCACGAARRNGGRWDRRVRWPRPSWAGVGEIAYRLVGQGFVVLAVDLLVMAIAATVAGHPGTVAWTLADAALSTAFLVLFATFAAMLVLVASDVAESRAERLAGKDSNSH